MRRLTVRAFGALAVPFGVGGLAASSRAALLARGLVHDAAGAHDLAQEGVRARVVALAGGIADGLESRVAVQGGMRDDALPLRHPQAVKVRGDNGQIDVAPFVGVAVRVGAIKDYGFDRDLALEGLYEVRYGSV